MSIERLIDVADAAETEAPELAAWLRRGIDTYLAGTPLEEALFGRTANGRSARQAYCEARRNAALRRAAALIEADTPTARSKALAREARAFARRRLKRWQMLGEPPAGATALHCALFEAFRWGGVPESGRQLLEITREIHEAGSASDFAA